MAHRITDSEKSRIEDFARTPKYARGPDMLVPRAREDEEEPSE